MKLSSKQPFQLDVHRKKSKKKLRSEVSTFEFEASLSNDSREVPANQEEDAEALREAGWRLHEWGLSGRNRSRWTLKNI